MEDRYNWRKIGLRSFEIHELGEGNRENRENRAVPTIPFRRKVNFSVKNSTTKFLVLFFVIILFITMIIPGKYSFDFKRVKTVPIKGIDD